MHHQVSDARLTTLDLKRVHERRTNPRKQHPSPVKALRVVEKFHQRTRFLVFIDDIELFKAVIVESHKVLALWLIGRDIHVLEYVLSHRLFEVCHEQS